MPVVRVRLAVAEQDGGVRVGEVGVVEDDGKVVAASLATGPATTPREETY